jgi:serine/threonine-protein kinase
MAQGRPAPVVPVAGVLPAVGDLVEGKYRIVAPLGEGAMGTVYRARDERLERDVALKLIRPSWSHSAHIQHVFVSEARAMARVNHPNVVEIYDFGWAGQAPYFVMEFIEGVDLERWMGRRPGLLAVDEALGVVERICKGVSAIHDSGAVHRDLKPGNVIIGTGFRVAVADLGLAQIVSVTAGDGMLVGSPGFMAPEMIRGDRLIRELLPRMDIYALGAIAYELLTSRPAFDGETPDELLENQRQGEFAPASELRPELPGAFDAVIAKAMALLPMDRHRSVEEFRRALVDARYLVTAKPRGRRVVVIDDDPADLALCERLLRAGLPDVVVETHADAHAALRAMGQDIPALIVTDLRMPTMDGAQLVAAVRAVADFNRVPIVVVSAEGGSREWKDLRKIGADGFLLKPLDPIPLRALVDSLLDAPMRVRSRRDTA